MTEEEPGEPQRRRREKRRGEEREEALWSYRRKRRRRGKEKIQVVCNDNNVSADHRQTKSTREQSRTYKFLYSHCVSDSVETAMSFETETLDFNLFSIYKYYIITSLMV